MRLRNTLLLALVFLSLGAYLYFFELKKDPAGKGEKLLPFKEEEVDSLILSYPDQEIRIKKESSGKWKITHPLEAAADESTVSDVLSALAATDIERTIEKKPSAEDLQAFGLDNPKVKVSIALHKAKTLPAVLVGAKTPVGNSSYVQRQSDPAVLLTHGSLPASLEKTLYDFRDKKIIEFKEQTVKRIALKGEKGDFVVIRKEPDWFLDQPKPYRADQAEVNAVLSTLRNMRAQDFVEEMPRDLKPYGLDKPRLRVGVSLGEKEGEREILFGDKRENKGEVYLVLDSKATVYTVSERIFQELNKDLNTLRDKEIFPFPQDRVAQLHIQSPKESFILVKGEKEGWMAEAPRRQKAQEGTVTAYLTTLGRIRAKGFAEGELKDLKRYGLNRPSLKISLGSHDGKNVATLLVGERIGADYYAKREDNPSVYTIEEFSYRQLNKQSADFLGEETKDRSPAGGARK